MCYINSMIRSGHFFYDLRTQLASAKLLLAILLVAIFFILFVSVQFIYIFVLLFAAILAMRSLIGRRCPHCDRALKEMDAERDKDNVFTMYVVWRCPHDGYEEKEKIKGDSGLFGAK